MQQLGNLLGSTQAEADQEMLSQAFIETADYLSLLHTKDFSYVVGRRGTGKSAIYQRLKQVFISDTGIALIIEEPQDYEMLELHSLLKPISSDYRVLRPISRLLWTVNFLSKSAAKVVGHYLFETNLDSFFLTDYTQKHRLLLPRSGAVNCSEILRHALKQNCTPEEIPSFIASHYEVGQLTNALRNALSLTGLRIVTLCDRLDESWMPEMSSAAVLGGLAKMAADYREKNFLFYPILFIRDNMFRVLAQFDDDFTRHIEGHSLRLHWNEESLLHFVTARLRIALNLQKIESEVKVWNRFAHRDLQNREGFKKCLRYTLFRPRDILVLLNDAYVNARREGRDAIIDKDVERSAVGISQNRLDDLCKEYDRVLPGIRLFVSSFRGQPAKQSLQSVIAHLQYLTTHSDYADPAARDFALFESGGEMFSALYSIGFIGLQDRVTGSYNFCHDGSTNALVSLDASLETLVHPCYWKALDVSLSSDSDGLLIQVHDEYTTTESDQPAQLRLQRLGRFPEELSNIKVGHEGSRQFEVWVQRAVRLLFSGNLTNIELKLNPHAPLNQRDIVATNTATSTFWRRVFEDYHSRQVIFECKNHEELTQEDFTQLLDQSTSDYGNFAVAVRRGRHEFLTEKEKDRTRALFYEHRRLIMIIPDSLLTLCIRKLRTPKKYDYTEYTINKHLDTIVRSVLNMTHTPRYKIKK